MPEPLRVSVYFDAQNRVSLQQGAADLGRLTDQVHRLSSAAATLPRAVRVVEADLNRLGHSAYQSGTHGVRFLSEQFSSLYGVLYKFSKIGFGGVIASTGLAVYGMRELSKEFLKINEQFANLEISVGSAFKSRTIGKQLREQLREITVTSPVPFQGLASATRAISYIPQLSSQIGKQASNGTLSDQKGFFRQYIQLIEQLMVFRPDKAVEDATFAIREAATGELRSLIRRFDFPAQLLVSASGKSIDELKKDPVSMVKAIKASLDKIITPDAIRKIAFQPSKLFANIQEQLKDIPLLQIGDSGLYDKILRFFEGFFNGATSFITKKFPAYAQRFSDSLGNIFDGFISSSDNISEKFMGMFELDARSLPALSKFERVTIGIERGLKFVEATLPGVLTKFAKIAEIVVPAFVKLMSGVTEVITFLADKFNKSPILTTVGAYLFTQITSAFRFGGDLLVERYAQIRKANQFAFTAPSFANARGISGFAATAAGATAAAVSGGASVYTPPNGVNAANVGLTSQARNLINSNAAAYASNVALLRRLGLTQVGNTPIFSGAGSSVGPSNVSAMGFQSGRNTRVMGYGPSLGSLGLAAVSGAGFNAATSTPYSSPALNSYISALRASGAQLTPAGIAAIQANQPLTQAHFRQLGGRFLSQTAFQNLPPRPLTAPGLAQLPPGFAPLVGGTAMLGYQNAAANGGSFAARLAGRAGASVLGAGLGTGAASLASGAVLTAGSIAATVLPVLAIIGAAAAFGMLVNKAADIIEKRQTAYGSKVAESLGLSGENLKDSRLTSQENANFLAALKEFSATRSESVDELADTNLTIKRLTKAGTLADARPDAVFPSASPLAPSIPDTISGLSSLFRSKQGFGLNESESNFSQFRETYAATTSDLETVLDLVNRGPTLFAGLKDDLKLLSNPKIEITTFVQLKEVAKLLTQSLADANAQISKLSEKTREKFGVGIQQLRSQEQDNVFSQASDFAKMFVQGKGATPELLNEANKSGSPTALSKLYSKFGALRESEEVPRLIQESSDQLTKIRNDINPFSALVASFREENTRLAEIRTLRAEVIRQGTAGLGEATGKNIDAVLQKLKETKTFFPEAEKLGSIAQGLKSGSDPAIRTAYDHLLGEIQIASLNGVESRVNQLLAVFASEIPKLTSVSTNAEMDGVKGNLIEFTKELFDQLRARSIDAFGGVDDLGKELFAEIQKVTSPNFLNDFTSNFAVADENFQELVGDVTAANARLQLKLSDSLEEVIYVISDAIETTGDPGGRSSTLKKTVEAVRKMLSTSARATIELYTRNVQNQLTQLSEALGTSALSGIQASNGIGGALSKNAAAALQFDPRRKRYGASQVPDSFIELMGKPNTGEFGFEASLKQTSEVFKIATADAENYAQSLTFVNGVVDLSKLTNQEQINVYGRYRQSLQLASDAQQRFQDILSNSKQGQAFNEITSQVQLVTNSYDKLIVKRNAALAQQFASQRGLVTPNSSILQLDEVGNVAVTNRLAKYAELENTARQNYITASDAAQQARINLNYTEAEGLQNVADSSLAAAASFRQLQDEVVGRGFFTSFTDGFGEMVSAYRAAANNMKEIGKQVAEGFSSTFASAFSDFAVGTKSASQAIADFGRSFLQMAINLFAQKAVQSLLGMVFGGIGGISSVASGGGTEMSNMFKFGGGRYNGGLVPGVSAGRDNVLAMLEGGEMVIPSRTVRKFGADHFTPYLKGYYDGGLVSSPSGSPSSVVGPLSVRPGGLAAVTRGGDVSSVVNVTVNVASDGTATSKTDNARMQDSGAELGKYIEATVLQVLSNQQRQAGLLSRNRR